MALSRVHQQCIKLFPSGYKTLCYFSNGTFNRKPYWVKYFPDDRIRYIEEMPTVGPLIDEYKTFKIHESYQRWVKDVGHVVREFLPNGSYCVHIYHKDDFRAIHLNDGIRPLRKSHGVIAKYRRTRPKFFESVGLVPSLGAEWAHLRRMLTEREGMLHLIFQPYLEQITNDFINLVQMKLNQNNEIDILPLLYCWAVESFGLVAFNMRLNALSIDGNERIDNLILAARLTNEIVFLSNVCDFEKQYERLVPVQSYFSSLIMTYMFKAAADPNNFCLVNKLLERYNSKDVIPVVLDLFQGAISSVPLTLTWALYHLACSPDTSIQSRAREQLTAVLPNKDSLYYEPDSKVMQETLFLKSKAFCVQAILRETLRLIPPTIGIGRVNREDLILGGYLVPSGSLIVLQSQAACRLEANFKRPLEFLPSRFMDLNELNPELKISFPFGVGHRACPGFFFAQSQMILALSKILRNFEVSYHHEEVGVINKLHNEPDRPVILRLKPLEN